MNFKLLLCFFGFLILTGFLGGKQDIREANLASEKAQLKSENKLLKEVIRLKDIRIDRLVYLSMGLTPPKKDTVKVIHDTISVEKKTFIPTNLTGAESLQIGRSKYAFIYNQKRDSLISNFKKGEIIVLKGKDTIKK